MRFCRNEIKTRVKFAQEQAEVYFQKSIYARNGGGNILSCKATQKFLQAKRIYDYYCKEFGLVFFPEIYKTTN